MIGGKGQERHIARALDGASQHTLVLGASAGLATRTDLAPVGDVLLQAIDLLVRYLGALVAGASGRTACPIAASPPTRAAGTTTTTTTGPSA